MNNEDWRLFRQQENYLSNAVLIRHEYKPINKNNDHDHCEFCMTKFYEFTDDLHFGYSTQYGEVWICEQCFEDFKEKFNWKVKK